ncbi:MAG: hypothetical protein QY331_03670 [Melioribacteraceae bacterium]|nr:MAG: hypothetical protein QY331_03670 [Melioribacteraceae bacterium]
MFIGHFGVGLGAKKIDSKPSLGTLFFASQFIDLLWPIFLLLGIEQVIIEPGNTVFTPLNFIYYPFTHSLAGVVIWGLIFGVVYFLIKKNYKTAILLGLLVISHWILDFITHAPDLPLIPGLELKVGLGLWNSLIFTLLFEVAIFSVGLFYYLKVTKAKNKQGNYGFWGLIIFLLVIYIMNVFGSTPPNEEAIAWAGNLQWLFIIWAYWVDRNRDSKI